MTISHDDTLSESAKAFLDKVVKQHPQLIEASLMDENTTLTELSDQMGSEIQQLKLDLEAALQRITTLDESNQKFNSQSAELTARTAELVNREKSLLHQLESARKNNSLLEATIQELRNQNSKAEIKHISDIPKTIREVFGDKLDPIFGANTDKCLLVKLATKQKESKMIQFEVIQANGSWEMNRKSFRKTW